MNFPIIAACLTAALILLLPGWALLGVSGAWKVFRPLQRWIIAFGISAAFFPVLYYLLNVVLPEFRLGVNKLWFLLVLFLLISLLFFRKELLNQVRFEGLEWVGIIIFALTLFSRLFLLKDYPYPAWSDSLHHTLLTLLTGQQGGLPSDLTPFTPTPLGMYHLGLYALTAPVMLLAKVEASTALLVIVQILNGLCGAGIYLILDRSGHRLGAVVGASVVGLFSFQPAWYFNWGRDTQLASQSILLIALVLTLAAAEQFPPDLKASPLSRKGLIIAAGLGNAAVFLLHFRVAVFYLPVLSIALLWQWISAIRKNSGRAFLLNVLFIGLVSLICCLPALATAVPEYLKSRASPASADPLYYQFVIDSVFSIGLQKWLVIATIIALVIGITLNNKISWWVLIWTMSLFSIGFAYMTGIRLLMVTNIGAVIIMLYLPAALAIGAVVSALTIKFKVFSTRSFSLVITTVLVIAGFFGAQDRIRGIESFRYFIHPADITAMNWIRANTPIDAQFAINTYFWLKNAPHGTDAGYWIPYFTGRKTTASTMLFSLGPEGFPQKVIDQSLAAERLAGDAPTTDDLCRLGFKYAYSGKNVDFSGPSINVSGLMALPGVDLLYQSDGVSILKICPD